MTPWNATPLSSPPHSLRSTLESPARSRWASLVARVRASTWAAVGARVVAVAAALLVLGWIGRTAAAGPTAPMSVGSADHDAGAAFVPAPALAALDSGSAIPVSTSAAVTTGLPEGAAPTPAAGAARGRATATEPVYLNHASVEELRRLPGVGPKRAEAILVLRQRLGRFQRVEDLLRVKGVGRGAVKKWRPLVRLDAPVVAGAAGATGAPDGGST
jgi:competence protein ComEA